MFRPNVMFRGLSRFNGDVRPKLALRTFRRSAVLQRADSAVIIAETPSPSGEGRLASAKSSPLTDCEVRKNKYAEIVEQVRVMNEYFSQYVDEYYEEEVDEDAELDEEKEAAMRHPTKEEQIKALAELYERRLTLPPITDIIADDVVELLRQQRAKDIVCLRMPTSEAATLTEHIVICEAHNSRHAHAMITNIRKYVKDNHRFGIHNILPPRVRKGPAPQWFNIDLRSVMLHILTPKTRLHYDLEALYGADDGGFDLMDQFQSLKSALNEVPDRSLLPPPTQ